MSSESTGFLHKNKDIDQKEWDHTVIKGLLAKSR